MIIWAKSLLFTIVFYVYTLFLCLLFIPTFFLPRKYTFYLPKVWARSTVVLLKLICGIEISVKGLKNLPEKNGYLVASKHQSALETILLINLIPNQMYILKQELFFIPLVGAYFKKLKYVFIDRKGGMSAMKKMAFQTKKQLNQNFNVIIFPEGTRVAPDQNLPFHPGVAFLYDQCKVPVVPIALNTGYFWPKNKIIKKPGRVTIHILKPIQPGLSKREFLETLSTDIFTTQKNISKDKG